MSNMFIPAGMTEQEVLSCINVVASRLAKKYRFGFFTEEDIKQEAYIILMNHDSKILKEYTPGRPLENYLAIVLHNRLFNFKRNNYTKPNPPCIRCPLNAYIGKKCTKYHELEDCSFYSKWQTSNSSIHNLMYMVPVDSLRPNDDGPLSIILECDSNFMEDVQSNELKVKILSSLKGNLRKSYLMISDGITIPKKDLIELTEYLKHVKV